MSVRWLTAFLDRPPAGFGDACAFWEQVTGSTLSPFRGDDGEFATLLPADGDAYLRVQRVRDGVGGCHLDLHADDMRVTARRAVDAGAVVHDELDDVVVLRSPAGMGFCVVAHLGEAMRPPPTPGPGGSTSLVDQLSIDVPPAAFEAECAFWQALTGWELRPARLPGYAYLTRPDPMPLRLLFQRRDEAGVGEVANGHLDVACDDREATVDWHQRLGARVGGVFEHWTTMTDPAGLPYCLTRRSPATGLLISPG